MIDLIFPEQEALIPVYLEKWKQIGLSTERINPEQAADTIKKAYAFLSFPEPEIIFCNSPDEAKKFLFSSSYNLRKCIAHEFHAKILWNAVEDLIDQRDYRLSLYLGDMQGQLEEELSRLMWFQLMQYTELERYLSESWLRIEEWAAYGSAFDFVVSVLEYFHTEETWNIFKSLVKDCGLIFPFQEVAIICDRPTKISFNNQSQLHAEDTPAIQFSDGYSVYAYNGVIVPENYGAPSEWKASWLLSEANAEIRRALIQRIGYECICHELEAIELDSWREYTLLKINQRIDVEPVHLLKMICPSTENIHILRVPPSIVSARDAICWINWGTDPEDFMLQS